MKVKEILFKKRKEKNMTQKDLAKILGISSKYLSDLECERKPISKNCLAMLDEIFKFSDDELKILLNKNNSKEKTEEKKISEEKELKEKVEEIILTYKFIREHHNDYAIIAKINRNLIELHKTMESYIAEIEISISGANEFVFNKVEGPIKKTIKRLEENEKRLLNLSLKEVIIEIK